MAAPDTNGVEVDRAVGQGEFHGIPVGQSPQRPGLSAPPGVDPAKLRAEPVTLSQTQPSPNRLMDQGGSGVGTPSRAAVGLRQSGSAGRLTPGSGAASPTRSLSESPGLRGISRSPLAAGPLTFGNKFMPFAAGFSRMAETAPVYRTTRLTTINPTAAETEDMSFYYTLDSGRTEPGAYGEHVRSSRAAARSASGKGGFFGRMMGPIE